MTRTLSLALFLFCFSLNAQTNYTVEEFKNSNDFYSAFNSGSGSVYTTNNTSNYYSGQESLTVNYTFNSGSNSFFSILKNYATATQDFSFQTDSIAISVKGGDDADRIAIRLWEDQNFNGTLDGSDEVYTSIQAPFKSTNWHTIKFALSDFIIVTGAGNNTLDLNRIRAYDIAIHNSGSSSHTQEVLIDKLELQSTYSPPNQGNAQLSGSFIQLWNTSGCNCGNWNQAQWDEEIKKMKAMCLDKLIIQYGVYHDHAWYSPSSLSFVQYQSTAMNKIFDAAEKEGLTIYVGLYFDETWNSSNKETVTEYNSLLTKHKQVLDEVYGLFGSSPSFGGWYIPQEINDYEWQNNPAKNLLFNWVKDVTDYANNISNAPIIIAPFFNLWQPADVLKTWYDELLTAAPNLTSVYPQDGVGIQRKNVNYHVPLYYKAIQEACTNNNRNFGATVESFKQLTGWPIDNGSFSAESANWDTLKQQVWEADRHNPSDIIQFSYSYMQNNSSTANDLVQSYQNYINCTPTKSTPIAEASNIYYKAVTKTLEFETIINQAHVYSIKGELLINLKNKKQIQLSNFSPGVYFLMHNQNEIFRFVIQP